MTPIVELQGIRHSIGGRVLFELPDWRVARGEHCLILGPSGSGKTTLLYLLCGYIKPTAGRVLIDGQALEALTPRQLDAFRGRHIGVVFQTLHLLPALSVLNNLRLAQYLGGLSQDKARAVQTLAALGIADKIRRRPSQLSQGEAQRVAIARAVINQPPLILADEPTSALDDRSCEQVLDLLFGVVGAGGATLLVATHDSRIKPRFQQRLDLSA